MTIEDAMKMVLPAGSCHREINRVKFDTSITNDSANVLLLRQTEKGISEDWWKMDSAPKNNKSEKATHATFIAILVMLLCLAVVIATIEPGKTFRF